MKIVKFCLGVCGVLAVMSCTLSNTFQDTPLSSREELLVGAWKHSDGVAGDCTLEFAEDRSLQSDKTYLVFGSSYTEYIWEADGDTLYLYDAYAMFLRPSDTWEYSFADSETLVIDGSEYTFQ